MSAFRLLFVLLLLNSLPAAKAQQIADTAFSYANVYPRYAKGKGSVVWIDEAHFNFHTLGGRYAPFAKVLQQDGYQVGANTRSFDQSGLSSCQILVISNALDSSNAVNWQLPTPSAFSADEIRAVHDWVKNGGRLLLIADHMPFAGAAQELGQSFGIEFLNCFALDNRHRSLERFFKGNGTLLAHPITAGIDTILTFTGSAFRIPKGATPLLALKNYTLISPVVAWQFEENTPTLPSDGYYQGACLVYGKGRVVVMGEAAMFSAQLAGPGRNKVGMNAAEARQNAPLLLNILHWLDE